jgi:hypothetical protein
LAAPLSGPKRIQARSNANARLNAEGADRRARGGRTWVGCDFEVVTFCVGREPWSELCMPASRKGALIVPDRSRTAPYTLGYIRRPRSRIVDGNVTVDRPCFQGGQRRPGDFGRERRESAGGLRPDRTLPRSSCLARCSSCGSAALPRRNGPPVRRWSPLLLVVRSSHEELPHLQRGLALVER